MSTVVATSADSLPPDLFYEIVVDLLTEYLDVAILHPEEARPWNAFVVLPLVSHFFRFLTNSFFVKLFGEVDRETIDFAVRKQRFSTSKALWARTKVLDIEWNPVTENFNPEEIPRPYEPLTHAVHVENPETMCCLDLWCPFMSQALRMCDSILPRRNLKFVGAHLAYQTAFCYSHDCVHQVKIALENLLRTPQLFDTETYVGQTMDSLENLEKNRSRFLWLGGVISQTFPMTLRPTRAMLQSADILPILLKIVSHEWDDRDFSPRARTLHDIYTARLQEV